MSADLGQADGGHHAHQQPVHQQQVQHSWSQGETSVRTPEQWQIRPRIALVIKTLVCFFPKQVGTLDVLVGLSDELAKLDTFVEG